MPRLIRPNVPLDVDLRVLLRQLGEVHPDSLIEIAKEQHCLGTIVAEKKALLAAQFGCEVHELRRDHNPPLGARQKVYDQDGKHVDYIPAANDPDYLNFRPQGAQYGNSHRTKTLVRGEKGQLSDTILIARNRKLEKKEKVAAGLIQPRPKAKIQGASRFPPKGSRKVCWWKARNDAPTKPEPR